MSVSPPQDLLDFLDLPRVECLNQSPQHTIQSALKKEEDDSYLESDTDEQLLIHIQFTQAVRIHSFVMKAPEGGSGPRKIKLFVNNPTIGFSEALDSAGVQNFELSKETVEKGTPTTLRFVKFQNVNCLSLFVESNQEDEETTVVSLIKLLGYSGEVMNVANIKSTAQEED